MIVCQRAQLLGRLSCPVLRPSGDMTCHQRGGVCCGVRRHTCPPPPAVGGYTPEAPRAHIWVRMDRIPQHTTRQQAFIDASFLVIYHHLMTFLPPLNLPDDHCGRVCCPGEPGSLTKHKLSFTEHDKIKVLMQSTLIVSALDLLEISIFDPPWMKNGQES